MYQLHVLVFLLVVIIYKFSVIELLLLYDYYYDFYELFGTVILFLYPGTQTDMFAYLQINA